MAKMTKAELKRAENLFKQQADLATIDINPGTLIYMDQHPAFKKREPFDFYYSRSYSNIKNAKIICGRRVLGVTKHKNRNMPILQENFLFLADKTLIDGDHPYLKSYNVSNLNHYLHNTGWQQTYLPRSFGEIEDAVTTFLADSIQFSKDGDADTDHTESVNSLIVYPLYVVGTENVRSDNSVPYLTGIHFALGRLLTEEEVRIWQAAVKERDAETKSTKYTDSRKLIKDKAQELANLLKEQAKVIGEKNAWEYAAANLDMDYPTADSEMGQKYTFLDFTHE